MEDDLKAPDTPMPAVSTLPASPAMELPPPQDTFASQQHPNATSPSSCLFFPFHNIDVPLPS